MLFYWDLIAVRIKLTKHGCYSRGLLLDLKGKMTALEGMSNVAINLFIITELYI